MAPLPDDPHYDSGSPLDGAGAPTTLAGNSTSFSPTALEIGLIVGVVFVVIVSLVWLFVWRSRRNRRLKNAAAATVADGHHEYAVDTHEMHEPIPLPKDERASTVENDEASSIERPPRSRNRPIVNWNHFVHPSQRNHGDEHEIANRI